jgi:O-acetyl-ADP-ribose deacetylase (regulator of RNase III)
MCTLEARFFPEQIHDAVLFWDPSVLSELLRVKLVSSTVHSGHTHLLRFESEAATDSVLHNANNMSVGEGVQLQLRQFGKSSPNQTDIQDGSAIVFLYMYGSGAACNRRIVIDQVDVDNLPVDSLVYSADQSFSFDGGLAKRIAQTAGPEFLREVEGKLNPPNPVPAIGQAMITGSGQLASTRIKSIVHAMIPHFSNPSRDQLMERAVYSALCLAAQRGALAAGITVMGSGQFNWPVEAAAEALVSAILASFRVRGLLQLGEVRIFDRDAAKIAAVLNYIRTQCSSTLIPAVAHPPPPAVRCSPSGHKRGSCRAATHPLAEGLACGCPCSPPPPSSRQPLLRSCRAPSATGAAPRLPCAPGH